MTKRLLIFLFLLTTLVQAQHSFDQYGARIRSDTLTKAVYLCFTGHDFNEGFNHVLQELKSHEVKASFFLTGYFIDHNKAIVKRLQQEGHYIGAHSDEHLLYNDWSKRDSLLHSPGRIKNDIEQNLDKLEAFDIHPKFFMPPYEWYNQQVVDIALELEQKTVNFSPGTLSNADYTSPDMANYRSSEHIYKSIVDFERQQGMNGFHLLIHPGTSALRKDKFYLRLGELLDWLIENDYGFSTFQE